MNRHKRIIEALQAIGWTIERDPVNGWYAIVHLKEVRA